MSNPITSKELTEMVNREVPDDAMAKALAEAAQAEDMAAGFKAARSKQKRSARNERYRKSHVEQERERQQRWRDENRQDYRAYQRAYSKAYRAFRKDPEGYETIAEYIAGKGIRIPKKTDG